ncbi:CPBP family intramembrane glutamic endopeptidase [Flavobacterium microcysteis]|uniref:CPBP family intramembrane metalloprotease n=1 Tax=Flavobacterium microcysteis TaxID=2596891 RepID=A0A501QEH7_9FLAO|nr:CPBP family intramembrane glutamic endopeptidase [Flavobacterium microcysteis]TPD71230.1 CPBP family intramembrane metalloprotease [Flavobacterium microcysteis]
MLGLILLLSITYGLSYFYHKSLSDTIGLIPNRKKMLYFLAGFLLVSTIALFNCFIESSLISAEWKLNNPINFSLLAKAAWYFFISVFTEELIFRGILLYILIEKIGAKKAVLVSAMIFGIYHWFSYGMFGSGIIPMLYIFFITTLAGYVWGIAFTKSKTLLLPLGFHFGWNLINSLFRKSQPYGEILYHQVNKATLSDLNNLFVSLFTGIFPSILMYLAVYLMFRKKKVL